MTRLTMAGRAPSRNVPASREARNIFQIKEEPKMPKTTFVRKPVCIDDVRSGMETIRGWFGGDRTHYYVASEIELTHEELTA